MIVQIRGRPANWGIKSSHTNTRWKKNYLSDVFLLPIVQVFTTYRIFFKKSERWYFLNWEYDERGGENNIMHKRNIYEYYYE